MFVVLVHSPILFANVFVTDSGVGSEDGLRENFAVGFVVYFSTGLG